MANRCFPTGPLWPLLLRKAWDTRPPTQEAGPKRKALSSRVAALETSMTKVATGVRALLAMQKGEEEPASSSAKPTLKLKAKAKPVAKPNPGLAFTHLDPTVAKAAMDAGVTPQALAELNRLVASGHHGGLGGGLGSREGARKLGLHLSESEEEAEEPVQEVPLAEAPAWDPVSAAIQKLAQVVETLAQDKARRKPSSQLDLLVVLTRRRLWGPRSLEGGISLRRNAAARRALRAALQDNPQVIARTILSLMEEDLHGAALPGSAAPSIARSWTEHRSRIGPFQTIAKAAWGVSGAIHALRLGKAEEAEALMQLDQVAVDRGS